MPSRTTAKERVLNAAAKLFYAHGVAATGIDTITTEAGVAKMSLYNNFSSKADLVKGYLDNRVVQWQQLLADRLERAKGPDEQVMAVFDSYIDQAHLAYAWGFRGCGLLNAAAELPVGDPGRATVAFQKEEVERLFGLYLGAMRPDAGAAIEETAQHLSYLLEGAMARAGLDGHDGRLKSARKISLSIVRQFADTASSQRQAAS